MALLRAVVEITFVGNGRLTPIVLSPSTTPITKARIEDHFASKSFIAEISAAVGAPVAFRLRCLTAPRGIAIVQGRGRARRVGAAPLAAARPRRRHPARPRHRLRPARGRSSRSSPRSRSTGRTGKVWARKFTVAHDCGLIINPDGLRRCIEGNVVQGTSRALSEEVGFDRAKVTSVDWLSYPILDITE